MIDKKIDRRIFWIILISLVFLMGLLFYKTFAGLILIAGLMLFGSLALMWKEKDIRLACLAAFLILAIANITINGLKFGIDFNGGVRIPIILEKSIDQTTMNELVETIKKRVSILGLSEAKVRAVGDSEIDVELPIGNKEQVDFIEQILSQQGVFNGIVDGKIALNGDDVYTQSITPLSSQLQDWSVSFRLTTKGADKFAAAVKGKTNKPLYMFLDRPSDAIVFVSMETLRNQSSRTTTDKVVLNAVKNTLLLENDDIELYVLEKLEDNENFLMNIKNVTPKTNKTKAILDKNTPENIKTIIRENGFVLKEVTTKELIPSLRPSLGGNLEVDSWEAIGLLSAPNLEEGVTQGTPNYAGYSIGGDIPGNEDQQTRARLARENIKRIESILKGGALPVQISLGSKTEIPATLGSEFLKISLIGVLGALLAISVAIALRYRKPIIVLPIVIISISELIILVSILGSFTIDLASMAGIIAAIGVGVDAQIVITDEMLKHKKHDAELLEGMEYAFDIIKTNVIVAIVAMLPLLFSGIVEVIGFSISTMLGALLGFLLSRPAYAVLAERLLINE